MPDSFRARLIAGSRSPLLPVFAVIFLLPFGRGSELGVLACIVGAAILLARAPREVMLHGGARLALSLWACYFAAALVSAFGAVDPCKSWNTVAAFLRFAPLAFYTGVVVRDARRVRALCFGVGVWVALWTLDAWVQALTGWSLGGRADPERISGIFGAGDLKLGPVLAVLAPFVLWSARERYGRAGLIVAFLFMLGPVLLAGSRAAWLMYALVTIAFAWHETRTPLRFMAWLAAACAVALLAVGAAWQASPRFDARMDRTLLALHDNAQALNQAASGRLDIWHTAIKMYAAHPVAGVGVRGFRYAYPRYAPPNDHFLTAEACGVGEGACHPHQLLLEILTETGAIGLLLWLVGVALALRAWRRADSAARARAWPLTIALAAMLFPLNTHLAFYSAWWGLLFWWLTGLWCAALYVNADWPEPVVEMAHAA